MSTRGAVIDPVPTADSRLRPRGPVLWDLLAALDRPILVTGDEGLLQAKAPRGSVLLPLDFCQLVGI